MRFVLVISFLLLIVVSACKKTPATTPDPVNLLTGKWTLLPATFEVYTNGTLSTTSTQQYAAGDYGDFKATGEFETSISSVITTYQYKRLGDTITFDNVNKAVISTLTNTQLTYYFIIPINSTIYRKNIFYYKK